MTRRADDASPLEAEAQIREIYAGRIGKPLAPERIEVPGDPSGRRYELSAVSEDRSVLGVIHTHESGTAADAERKVIADAFKLVYAKEMLGNEAELVLLFGDEGAASAYASEADTWAAGALDKLGVSVAWVGTDALADAA